MKYDTYKILLIIFYLGYLNSQIPLYSSDIDFHISNPKEITTVKDTLEIKYFQKDERYKYRIKLLDLAMQKTIKTDGPFILKPVKGRMTQDRGIFFLKRNKRVDVAFLPTDINREKELLPVRIGILHGILGYRVFLIRKDSRDEFGSIGKCQGSCRF